MGGSSLDERDERLALFDDVRRELRRVFGADVADTVDGSGRNEQDVPCAERRRLPAVDLVLQGPFEDVDDLFARMRVPDERRLRGEVDAVLDDLSSRDAQRVSLEIGAPEP